MQALAALAEAIGPASSTAARVRDRAPKRADGQAEAPLGRRQVRKPAKWDGFQVNAPELGREQAPARESSQSSQFCHPLLFVRLPSPEAASGEHLDATGDVTGVPSTFDELVLQHRTLFDRLRRQLQPCTCRAALPARLTVPASEQIAAADQAIAHVAPTLASRAATREWTGYQRSLVSQGIIPVPVTDVRIAVYLATTIDAFGTRVAPRIKAATARGRIALLRKWADEVNAPFSLDGTLDAACPALIDAVVRAVSLPEWIGPKAEPDAVGKGSRPRPSAKSPARDRQSLGNPMHAVDFELTAHDLDALRRWNVAQFGERPSKRARMVGPMADTSPLTPASASASEPCGPDAASRSSDESDGGSSEPYVASSALGEALILLGKRRGKSRPAGPPGCETVQSTFLKFVELRRS